MESFKKKKVGGGLRNEIFPSCWLALVFLGNCPLKKKSFKATFYLSPNITPSRRATQPTKLTIPQTKKFPTPLPGCLHIWYIVSKMKGNGIVFKPFPRKGFKKK